MTKSPLTVDEKGVTLDSVSADSYDVYCDDQHVWSFSPPQSGSFVPWPEPMRRFLDGVADFRVEAGGRVVYEETTRFGTGTERIAFRDKSGIPIMIDKWGLIQRPFTGRGRGVVDQMVQVSDDIIRILADECGVHAWIAFGTLLGAAREGKVIGHDSDIDLAYLSHRPTPAAMALELYDITRALRRHGMRVLPKSGSFITVVFSAPDGGTASIDLYTVFYVGEHLHETATVRAVVPRSAIEPLTTMTFEGRALQAPADAGAMLEVSYGPGWKVPDPSFKHTPGPEVTERFAGWFGSLMRNRRDSERALRTARQAVGLEASAFADWVAERLPPGVPVIEVGCGLGADALRLGEAGWSVTALDYGRGTFREAARRARRRELPVSFEEVNLYELRETLTAAALLARRTTGPRTLVARHLLGRLDADGAANLWRLAGLLLRGGGTAYLEVEGPGRAERPPAVKVKRYPVTRASAERAARAAGAVDVEILPVPDGQGADGGWRLVAVWPERTTVSADPEKEQR